MSIPLATAIGFAVAILVAVALAFTAGTRKSDRSRRRSRGGPLTVLSAATVYLFVLIPVFTNPGINALSWVLFVVAVMIPPLVAARSAVLRERMSDEARGMLDALAAFVAFALLASQLSIASGALSLVGDIRRWVIPIGFGVCCAAYAMASGRTGSIRTSRYAVALLVGFAAIFAAGLLLGSFSSIDNPSATSIAMDQGSVISVILVGLALGCVDPNLRLAIRDDARPGRAFFGGEVLIFVAVALFSIGTMLVFGGAFQAPDLEVMTVFALIPGVAMIVVMLIVCFVLASNIDSLLTAGATAIAGDPRPDGEREGGAAARSSGAVRKAIAGLAVVGIVGAVLAPNPILYLTVGAFVAAAGAGALLPAWRSPERRFSPWPGFGAGIVAAIIVALITGPVASVAMTIQTVAVLVAAAVVSAVVSYAVLPKANDAASEPAAATSS